MQRTGRRVVATASAVVEETLSEDRSEAREKIAELRTKYTGTSLTDDVACAEKCAAILGEELRASDQKYTAAKHLLTELKATLSDLQEKMESSDRIAHQSEVSTKALDKLRADLQGRLEGLQNEYDEQVRV